MTDKENKRNLDPERMEQNVENETNVSKKFNTGSNESDFDGGHPEDSQPESDDSSTNGEEYARRQHGKDEIEDQSFNAGGNESDFDGGHPKDGTSESEGKIDS